MVDEKRPLKKPTVKMSMRTGTCRIYFSDREVTCPLCGEMVPAGQLHECIVGDDVTREEQ